MVCVGIHLRARQVSMCVMNHQSTNGSLGHYHAVYHVDYAVICLYVSSNDLGTVHLDPVRSIDGDLLALHGLCRTHVPHIGGHVFARDRSAWGHH